MFKIGDKVKFKDYVGTSEERGRARNVNGGWTDWKIHRNQVATIISKSDYPKKFDWKVLWKDGNNSHVDEGNLILLENVKPKVYGIVKFMKSLEKGEKDVDTKT